MEFRHLRTTACPDCGASPCREEIALGTDGTIRTHMNGQRWERRRFTCGREIEWIPNFGREAFSGTCDRSAEAVVRRRDRTAFSQALRDLLASSSLPLHDDDRARLAQAIASLGWDR